MEEIVLFVLHYGVINSIMSLNMELLTRFLQIPRDHFFLMGPRGTGKSSWVREAFPEAFYVDLLNPETLRTLVARPERLVEWIEAKPYLKQVIIDEVQKIPELLEVSHLLIERKKELQFIFTGSSARKLKRAGTNLLGGRATKKTLHPFMACELGEKFNFQESLKVGMLPVVYGSQDRFEMASAYSGLYLKEEIAAEAMVRNIGAFARFLEAISFSQASVINLSNIARECEVNRKTVEGYLDVLEDLLLAFRIPVFSKRAKRALASNQKFFFFDVGVFRSNRPSGPFDRVSEIEGVALEGIVAQHLRAWCDYRKGNHQLYFWHTRSKVEVDFIVYGEEGLIAIEVKNTDKVKPEDSRGLRIFAEDYPESKKIVLYRGKERVKQGSILWIPCEDFLRELNPDHKIHFS